MLAPRRAGVRGKAEGDSLSRVYKRHAAERKHAGVDRSKPQPRAHRSIEGDERQTDARRGAGTYQKLTANMERMHEKAFSLVPPSR
jgi:hypothetical protein